MESCAFRWMYISMKMSFLGGNLIGALYFCAEIRESQDVLLKKKALKYHIFKTGFCQSAYFLKNIQFAVQI